MFKKNKNKTFSQTLAVRLQGLRLWKSSQCALGYSAFREQFCDKVLENSQNCCCCNLCWAADVAAVSRLSPISLPCQPWFTTAQIAHRCCFSPTWRRGWSSTPRLLFITLLQWCGDDGTDSDGGEDWSNNTVWLCPNISVSLSEEATNMREYSFVC